MSDAKKKVEQSIVTPTPREPLAVIGIGCRLPGGLNSPQELWEGLLKGINAIREVPEDRWKHSRFHDTNPEKMGCIKNAKGGFIDNVDKFDADFFGYFPTEAQRQDPQQRLLLEVTHEAMEDAGLRRDQFDGSRTSVFAAGFFYDYLCMQSASEARDEINSYTAMGTDLAALANRISFNFNLKGPSVSLDTACSGSLVAVDLACRSIWSGQADMAVAAGANVLLRPETSIILSKAGFLNPDQYCKAFDASANGYVRSEGVAVVILKPLRQAMADKDSIYAVIRATAVNSDGYTPEGLTVPSEEAQITALRDAYSAAGIDPSTVSYVECHGPGTPVGDPIEARSLGTVLGSNRTAEQPLLIGSIKTNVGHLEGVSGIAGFIKGCLVAKHGIVPPNLHFKTPNPAIDFSGLHLVVPTNVTPLKRNDHALTIGVNSFGAGGTNAHAVIQEPPITKPESQPKANEDSNPTLYMLSAKSKESLSALSVRHADFLADSEAAVGDIAFSAYARRSYYPFVVAVVGNSKKDLSEKLREFGGGKPNPTTLSTKITHKESPKIGFLFSGQGGQWARMGSTLLEKEPVFRNTMEEIDRLFRKLAGISLLAEIAKPQDSSKIDDTVLVQPAVMAIQISLFKLYESYGIRPDGVVGHSIGEVAASFASGALSLEEAVKVIYHRSQAQDRASGKGGMLAVGLSVEEARKAIKGLEDRVAIGAVNGPEMLTLSGDFEPLKLIADRLEARGIFNRTVRVQVPYHSHHIEPIRELMLETLRDIRGREASTALYSTVSGKREPGTHLTAGYWFRNARQSVLFTDALTAMIQDGFDTFIEIGPHPVLVGGSESLFKKLGVDAIAGPSMTRKEPEEVIFLQSLARLTVRGGQANADAIFGSNRKYIPLPKYAWQQSRHWFETPEAAKTRKGEFDHPFLKHRRDLITDEGLAGWDANLDVHKFPYLRDHQVDGEIVLPATGHLDLAWAVAAEQFEHQSFFLENLSFESPLILPDKSRHPLNVHVEILSGEGDYRICTRPAEASADSHWTKHSSGRINTVHDDFEKSTTSLAEIRQTFRAEDSMATKDFYETLVNAGINYGPKFRCVEELWHRGHEVLARLKLADDLALESKRHHFHPSLFDACLHAIYADVHRNTDPDRLYLPYRISRVRFHRKPSQNVWAYLRVSQDDAQWLCGDLLIYSDSGELVAEVLGIQCKRLKGAGGRQADAQYEGCYEYGWVGELRNAEAHTRIHDCSQIVLIGEENNFSATLLQLLEREGVSTRVILLDLKNSYEEILKDVPLDRRTLLLFAPGLRQHSNKPWNGLGDEPAIPRFLELIQTLLKQELFPRLALVTSGAVNLNGDTKLDLGQATLQGMARVIRNEAPNLLPRIIDLSPDLAELELVSLANELLHRRTDLDEFEVALRGSDRFVRKLHSIDRDTAEQAVVSEESGQGGDYRADLRRIQAFDDTPFRRIPSAQLGEHDLEIAVSAAGLNYKDIQTVSELLPAHAVAGGLSSDRLGLEVAGQVIRKGTLVQEFQIGDEVIARVTEGLGGRVIACEDLAAMKPKHLTSIEAASIPVNFVTAWYALTYLGRIAKGETVLIQSAAGGVGTAAIQIAKRVGATIIATAGTKEKREYLQSLGIEHVFDSRSLDFYNQVMKVTKGRGVDIVLNSLSGRLSTQGIKCLAPFGRFLELGKTDLYRGGKVSAERLGEGISYIVVDEDRLAAQKPELYRTALKEVVAMFDRGELQAPVITKFPISKVSEAIKCMTRAAYRGKIVLTMENDRVRSLPERFATFRSDRSYLISGGASGFGLQIAKWMVEHGARHLALLSRSGCKSESDRALVDEIKGKGATILMVSADIADMGAVEKAIGHIKQDLPPLAGVIHGAAVMDDASIPSMNMERFSKVFQPKAQGAWNLSEATQKADCNLDFFLMLSSLASVFGFYGQINYAAANYFQDSLADYRRQRGLPGTVINLGVLGDYAGLSKRTGEANDLITLVETQGMSPMPLADILEKLEAVLIQKPVARMTVRFDWGRFSKAYPHLARDSRFVDLLNQSGPNQGGKQKGAGLRTQLAELDLEKRNVRLQQELAGALAKALDVNPEKLDLNASISDLNLDSLLLTQVRSWILRSLDINLPIIKLLKGPSLVTLASDLIAQLDSGSGNAANAKESSDSADAFTLADVEGIKILSPLLIRGHSEGNEPVRLICFHSMGVGASLFTKFLLNPPKNVDIVAVQTPGRENRKEEPVAESLPQLVDQIVPQLIPLLDRPFIIWGHSFGGITSSEVIRRLGEQGLPQPSHFVVTGTVAPHLIHLWQKREIMLKALVPDTSPEYVLSLSRYVDDTEFLKSILPLMRKDNPLLVSHRFEGRLAFDLPITAFAARQDDMVYSDEIRAWAQHTTQQFSLIEVDGDHWFLNRNRDLIMKTLHEIVTKANEGAVATPVRKAA